MGRDSTGFRAESKDGDNETKKESTRFEDAASKITEQRLLALVERNQQNQPVF